MKLINVPSRHAMVSSLYPRTDEHIKCAARGCPVVLARWETGSFTGPSEKIKIMMQLDIIEKEDLPPGIF